MLEGRFGGSWAHKSHVVGTGRPHTSDQAPLAGGDEYISSLFVPFPLPRGNVSSHLRSKEDCWEQTGSESAQPERLDVRALMPGACRTEQGAASDQLCDGTCRASLSPPVKWDRAPSPQVNEASLGLCHMWLLGKMVACQLYPSACAVAINKPKLSVCTS